MTFVVEQSWHHRWDCHREDAPHRVTGGPSPSAAFLRCCKIHQVDPREFVASEQSATRIVFRPRGACPACGGSGKYVGLTVVEPCGTCGGTGTGPASH